MAPCFRRNMVPSQSSVGRGGSSGVVVLLLQNCSIVPTLVEPTLFGQANFQTCTFICCHDRETVDISEYSAMDFGTWTFDPNLADARWNLAVADRGQLTRRVVPVTIDHCEGLAVVCGDDGIGLSAVVDQHVVGAVRVVWLTITECVGRVVGITLVDGVGGVDRLGAGRRFTGPEEPDERDHQEGGQGLPHKTSLRGG